MKGFSLGVVPASPMVGPCRRENTTRAHAAESVSVPSGLGGGGHTGVSDPPESAGPARVSTSLEWLEARRGQRRKSAARRRRRRRLLLIAVPLLGLLAWAACSYAIWMLKPTSMSFGPRSVEWVRAEVPFGNTIVDDVEHLYYTANAPKKGGSGPKRLPAVGLSGPRSDRTAAWPPPIRPVFAHRLAGKGSGNRQGRRSKAAHRCS